MKLDVGPEGRFLRPVFEAGLDAIGERNRSLLEDVDDVNSLARTRH